MEKLKIPSELIKLVCSLLNVEPKKRPTHDNILASSFLYDIKTPENLDYTERDKLLDEFLNTSMLIELQHQVQEYAFFLLQF
jgi:hypothetical protein